MFWLGVSLPSAQAPAAEVTSTQVAQQQQPAPTATPSAGSLIASGYVVARRKATVAAEVTGKVVELLVDEGMVVEAGQVLARLDDVLADKDYALAQARAEASDAAVAAIAADLADAERILNRTQTLSGKNYATEADLTKSQARAGVLRAQLRQAEAQLAAARLEAQRSGEVLGKHRIRAPFTGIVVERSAQPGEMISPLSAGGGFTRTGICTIVDMDSIEIEVDVNEASIGRAACRHPRRSRARRLSGLAHPGRRYRHRADRQSREGDRQGPCRHGCEGHARFCRTWRSR